MAKHIEGPWRWMNKTLVAGKNDKHILYAEEAPGLGRAAEPTFNLIAEAPVMAQLIRDALPELSAAALAEKRANGAPTSLAPRTVKLERYERAVAILARIDSQ